MSFYDALKKVGLEAIERRLEGVKLDAWVNELTGFGTALDKTTYGSYRSFGRLDDITLSALYHENDVAARMVDVVPEEMLREGFDLELGNPDLNKAAAEKVESLNLIPKLADAMRWARCYGGAALLLGADDGRPASMPLVEERVRSLEYVYDIDRRFLWPLTYYTEDGHPKLGEPETFMVTTAAGTASNAKIVHESRLVIFRGTPTGKLERRQFAGWDLSVLQRANEVIRQFDTSWKAVELMLTDGNQAVYKISGLAKIIATGGEELLRARLRIIELYRSIMRGIVISADPGEGGGQPEEFSRQQTSLAGVADTMQQCMLRLASAVQIPVTILMGQSPAGMNATGDSDFRWFFNRMKSQQRLMLTPKIRRIMRVWLQTQGSPTGGKIPDTFEIKYPELWTPTPTEAATIRKTNADADKVYFDMGAIEADEVAIDRFGPDGTDDLKLSPEGLKAREERLALDLKKIAAGEDTAPPAATPIQNAAPNGENATPAPAGTQAEE